jgi:hypothetical protein
MTTQSPTTEEKIVQLIDELNDLCDLWRKHRCRAVTPTSIQVAIINLAHDLSALEGLRRHVSGCCRPDDTDTQLSDSLRR